MILHWVYSLVTGLLGVGIGYWVAWSKYKEDLISERMLSFIKGYSRAKQEFERGDTCD